MSNNEILVLGATSLVGIHIIEKLVDTNQQVVAVSRNPPTSSNQQSRVRWIKADVTGPNSLDSLKNCTAAISTLPIWLTADLAPTLVRLGVKRIVGFSSSSAATKVDATDEGERALASRLLDGEARVRALSPALTATFLRPAMIYGGVGDANVERIALFVSHFRIFPVVGRGDGLRQPVHAQDLAAAAIAALFADTPLAPTYTLAGGQTLTVRAMVRAVAQRNRVRVLFIRVPIGPASAALRLASRLPRVRKIPPGALERITKDLIFDNRPAIQDLGYAPRPFEPPDYRVLR